MTTTAVEADLQVRPGLVMNKKDEIREKALKDLQQFQVLMLDGHFDFGNGYHGRLYLNPHQLFRYPSTIWRFAQDLIDVLQQAKRDPASTLTVRSAEGLTDVGKHLLGLLELGAKSRFLVITWHLLSDPGARYTDLGPDWHDRLAPQRRKRQLIAELERLSGKKVTLHDAA